MTELIAEPKAAVVAKLPDHVVYQLVQLADDGDRPWRQVARIVDQLFEDAAAENIRLPRMKLYQDVAAVSGQKLSTLRNWLTVYHKVGDELLDEFDGLFRYSHWRAILPAAKKAGKSIEDVARDLAATADNYAGAVIPVDAIALRVNPPEQAIHPFVDALDRARVAAAGMMRHAENYNRKLVADVAQLNAALDDLAKKALVAS